MTDADIEGLVRDFESGTLPGAAWDHAAHLSVALWYLRLHPRAEAVGLIRRGILRHNERQGNRDGYHETITLAWAAVVEGFLATHDSGQSLAELAGALVEACGDRGYLSRFYSPEVLRSDGARRTWVPPDRAPIEAGWPGGTADRATLPPSPRPDPARTR